MLLSWAWRQRLGFTVSGLGAPCSMKSYLLTSQAVPQAPSITPVGCCATRPLDARSKSAGSMPRSRGSLARFVWIEASFGNVGMSRVCPVPRRAGDPNGATFRTTSVAGFPRSWRRAILTVAAVALAACGGAEPTTDGTMNETNEPSSTVPPAPPGSPITIRYGVTPEQFGILRLPGRYDHGGDDRDDDLAP